MQNTKLLINLVIDNGASMRGEKILKLKNALSKFDSQITALSLEDRIEYQVVIFKGFNATVFKSFEAKMNIDNFYAGGIPFVNDSLKLSISSLLKRSEELEKQPEGIYKSWTVVMLNGENYDSLDESVELALNVLKAGKMSYFPFALTDCEFDKSLSTLRKLKQFTVVKDEMYEELFNWILSTAKMRVEKPINEGISIDPKSFEGWTIK